MRPNTVPTFSTHTAFPPGRRLGCSFPCSCWHIVHTPVGLTARATVLLLLARLCIPEPIYSAYPPSNSPQRPEGEHKNS